MREEKKFLVKEVSDHLEKSDYVFLTDFQRVTVAEVKELRTTLRGHGAEFHVVKNSALGVASRERALPALDEHLVGPTAIIVGGENPSGVAKILVQFGKDKNKLDLKAGILGKDKLSDSDVVALSKLPSLEVLRAQLLGLLNTPAQQLMGVLQGVPRAMVTVLNAKVEKGE